MLGGGDGLEADEGDLHGEDGADDVERAVGDVDAVREAARHHQDEHVQRDDVDQEHVAAPRRYLRGAGIVSVNRS